MSSTDLICDDLEKQQSVHGSDVKHVFQELTHYSIDICNFNRNQRR